MVFKKFIKCESTSLVWSPYVIRDLKECCNKPNDYIHWSNLQIDILVTPLLHDSIEMN